MEWELHLEVIYGMDKQIESGEPLDLYVFDRETYAQKYVKAIVRKNPGDLPGGETLWVRDYQGKIAPKPWTIKILEENKSPWEGL